VTPLPELLKRAKKLKASSANGTEAEVRAAGGAGPAGAAARFGDIQTRSQVSKDGKRFNINFVPKQFQLGPLFGEWVAGGAVSMASACVLACVRACVRVQSTLVLWTPCDR
jgi:hypothetical protein